MAITVRTLHMLSATILGATVFVREWVRLRGHGWEAPVRALGRAVVRLCTILGATFIKVGQIASTRGDLLPRSFIEELATLRDRVPPFPFATVRRIIETDLGRPLEEIFSQFDPEPVAAASVAQVHRAARHDSGETVAVKVRRPDILEKAGLDRSILLFLARAIERFVPTMRLVSFEAAMEQFCGAVEEQIHLSNEASNNRIFRDNFAGDPDVTFPVLHLDLCSDAVLTMEYVEGIREENLEACGLDLRRIVEAGMRCVCRMIFLHGFVHADLHPGNLRFRPPGQIVLFDLGLVGRLADEDRLTNARLLFAFATGDGATVARLFYESSAHAAVPDYGRYEKEICRYVDGVRFRGLARIEITWEIGRIFDILRRHRIQASGHMTMVHLAMMTAEGLGKRLAPELSLTHEALPYLAEALGVPMPELE